MSTAMAQRPTSGTTVAPRKFASVDDLLKDKSVQQQIARALPKGMDADRMMRIAISAVSKNPVLKECEPASVGLSIIKACEMGLQVDGWEGHLVPFRDKGKMKCQFIPDYKGLVKLAYQSELVIEIHAETICENDDFDYCKGTDTFLTWKPARGDRGQMVGAWAGAKMKGGGFPFIVMWRDEIMQHKAKSQAGNSSFSPWNTPEGEPWMWRKTALRSLCKFLPRSSQLLDLLKTEEAAELGGAVVDGVMVSAVEEDDQPKTSKADQMANRLAGNGSSATVTDPPFSPSTAAEQKEAKEILSAEADASATTSENSSVHTDEEILDGFKFTVEEAGDLTSLNKLRDEEMPKAPEHLQPKILELIMRRQTAIRQKHGK